VEAGLPAVGAAGVALGTGIPGAAGAALGAPPGAGAVGAAAGAGVCGAVFGSSLFCPQPAMKIAVNIIRAVHTRAVFMGPPVLLGLFFV